MKKEYIDIAIPAHNEEASIQRTLKSITASNFHGNTPRFLICLSACTDNTVNEIEDYKRKNKKIKINTIKVVAKGKVRAIKALDKKIDNKLIVFMDADCQPLKESIYKLWLKLK